VGLGLAFVKIEGLWCCGAKTNLALKAITKIIDLSFFIVLFLKSEQIILTNSYVHLIHIIKTSFKTVYIATCAHPIPLRIINNLLKEMTLRSIDVRVVQRLEAIVTLSQVHVLLSTDISLPEPIMRSSPGD